MNIVYLLYLITGQEIQQQINMAFFEETEESVDNSLWVEKYRPIKLDDYVGNAHLKEKIAQYIETEDVPHLLLFGRAGTGKTTLAKLVV